MSLDAYQQLPIRGVTMSQQLPQQQSQAKTDTIATVDKRDLLSVEEFIEQYEKPNKPVIIKGLVQNWKAANSWKLVCIYVSHYTTSTTHSQLF
jgi:hypothetical protein